MNIFQKKQKNKTTETKHQKKKNISTSFQPRIINPPDFDNIGHKLQKTKSGVRFWSNNLNTIGHRDSFAELHVTCKFLHEYHIDVIALQEINLDLLDHNIRHKNKQIF